MPLEKLLEYKFNKAQNWVYNLYKDNFWGMTGGCLIGAAILVILQATMFIMAGLFEDGYTIKFIFVLISLFSAFWFLIASPFIVLSLPTATVRATRDSGYYFPNLQKYISKLEYIANLQGILSKILTDGLIQSLLKSSDLFSRFQRGSPDYLCAQAYLKISKSNIGYGYSLLPLPPPSFS